MHEGVLILSKSSTNFPRRIAFCNNPASKLIHEIDSRIFLKKDQTTSVLSHDCFDFVQLE